MPDYYMAFRDTDTHPDIFKNWIDEPASMKDKYSWDEKIELAFFRGMPTSLFHERFNENILKADPWS